MVSALWKACSSGDLETVQGLLNNATDVDIEVKDHTGATPLIEAVKNGHVEVIKALLDKGADPRNGSSQGPPTTYTSDQHILDLLGHAQDKTLGAPPDLPTGPQGVDGSAEQGYQYGSSPSVNYAYYPSINSSLSPPLEGGVGYYPHPPQHTGENGGPGGLGNLPPPEIAKLIPCRYFPACRYGASCLFAHPQQYYPGSLPPPQYVTSYDPINVQPFTPTYFTPPPFQPPNGIHPMPPMSPPSATHVGHGHSPSEAALPGQPPFSPNGISPVPYGPLPPNAYPPPGQVPVPMMVPPPQHQATSSGPPSSNVYNTSPPSVTPYVQQQDAFPYPVPQLGKPIIAPKDMNGDAKQQDGPASSNHHPSHRDGMGYQRRGGRRGSFNARKPPCMFFPSGRCKNGDDCRFPHVLPDNNGVQPTSYFSGRGGARPRHINGNGIPTINEKASGPTVQEHDRPLQNSEPPNKTDPGRHRFHQGNKNGYGQNVTRDKRPQPQKQRVPNADEFPVLSGSITPPTRNTSANGNLPNGNGHAGPTAAQILQAPPPSRKENQKKSSPKSTPPESAKLPVPKAETNGAAPETTLATNISHDHPSAKLTASFATVVAPEMPKEITLSA